MKLDENIQLMSTLSGVSLGFFQEGWGEQMWRTFFTCEQPFQVDFSWNRYFYRLIVALRRGATHPLSKFSGCGRTPRIPSNEAPIYVARISARLDQNCRFLLIGKFQAYLLFFYHSLLLKKIGWNCHINIHGRHFELVDLPSFVINICMNVLNWRLLQLINLTSFGGIELICVTIGKRFIKLNLLTLLPFWEGNWDWQLAVQTKFPSICVQ